MPQAEGTASAKPSSRPGAPRPSTTLAQVSGQGGQLCLPTPLPTNYADSFGHHSPWGCLIHDQGPWPCVL